MTDDPRWRFAFNRVAGLVIDSYSTNLYPSARILSDYDQLDVMAYPNDLEKVRDLTRRPVEYFGWGSDVLDRGGNSAERKIDLLRTGPQPTSWDDDGSNERLFRQRGFRSDSDLGRGQSSAARYEAFFAATQKCIMMLAQTNLKDESSWRHGTFLSSGPYAT